MLGYRNSSNFPNDKINLQSSMIPLCSLPLKENARLSKHVLQSTERVRTKERRKKERHVQN